MVEKPRPALPSALSSTTSNTENPTYPGGSARAPASIPFDPAVGDDYRHRLLAHIQGYRQRVDGQAGQSSSGVVFVRFLIDRNGDVISASVASSSGNANFDAEAIATIWRARPMPIIPAMLPERLAVTLPINFGVKFAQMPR